MHLTADPWCTTGFITASKIECVPDLRRRNECINEEKTVKTLQQGCVARIAGRRQSKRRCFMLVRFPS